MYEVPPAIPNIPIFSLDFAEWISTEMLEIFAIPVSLISTYKVFIWAVGGFRVD
jgi:hypothetical protein